MKADFRTSDVSRVIEAERLRPFESTDERRKVLAWVELRDQPGLPELYLFEEDGNSQFRLVSDAQRRCGTHISLSTLCEPAFLLEIDPRLKGYVPDALPENLELVFLEDSDEPILALDVVSPTPRFAFQATLGDMECADLVKRLEAAWSSPSVTTSAMNDVLSGNHREAKLVTGPFKYGSIRSSGSLSGAVTIEAMLGIPEDAFPTLLLAALSVCYPSALQIESCLLEQPASTRSDDLCQYFEVHASRLFEERELAETFDSYVRELGGNTSLLSIVKTMPSATGVSAYF